MNELIENIDKLHTTKMGEERIKGNLNLTVCDPVEWCKDKILNPCATIERRGKNWYASIGDSIITVNAHNFCIITAHNIQGQF